MSTAPGDSNSQTTEAAASASTSQEGTGNQPDNSKVADEAPKRTPWTSSSPYFDALTMNADILDRLQQNIRFEAGSLYCLQVNGPSVRFNDYKVVDEDVKKDFLHKLEQDVPDVVIFFIPHKYEHLGLPKQEGIMRFNLGLEESTFVWMMQTMNVHPCFIESLHYNIGHYAVFTTLDDDGKAKMLHIFIKVPPAGHLEGACYFQYDLKTKRTVMLILGDDLTGQFETVSEHLMSNETPYNPFAIMLKITMRWFRFLEAQRRQIDHAVIMTERETGRGAVAYSPGRNETVSPDKIDLTNMHWIEGNQRNIVFASQFQAKLVSFLLAEYLHLIALRDQKAADVGNLAREDSLICERLRSHETMCKGLVDMCLVVRERVQRQLSAADSIINQSDNKQNLQNAVISTEIADQSRRIADESRSIAAETRRDSTSMKTIASLTMIYLPSTFAASIFSTGFFSYSADSESIVRVNPQIWKLFVVAVALTVATLGIWVWLNKRGIPAQFNWARQQGKSGGRTRRETAKEGKGSGESGEGGNKEPDAAVNEPKGPVPKITLPIMIPEDAV